MEKTVIHCPTISQFEKVRIKLNNGLYENWSIHKEKTCVFLSRTPQYSSIDWYLDRDYEIITAEQYLNEKGDEEVYEFKVGDEVEVTEEHHSNKRRVGYRFTITGTEEVSSGIWFAREDGNDCDGARFDCIKLISTQNKEEAMRKSISQVFERTEDALLVEKYADQLLTSGDSFVEIQTAKENSAAILYEAQRLEAEANSKD